MATQRNGTPTRPADIAQFWGVDELSLMRVQQACRAWFETSEAVQRQALDYLTERRTKDSALLLDVTKCTNAQDTLDLQTRYTGEAFDDLVKRERCIAQLIEAAVKKAQPN